jgi:NADH-quinone oxidoreductase subunit C
MSQAALEAIRRRFGADVIASHSEHGDDTVVVKRERLLAVAEHALGDPDLRFEMLSDLTAVDWLMQGRTPRFEVVYHLLSLTHRKRLRIKVPVAEEDPLLPSVTRLWRSATWMEREVWDLYGIRFDGHPDLRRILLYEEFQGHPLRKDYPMAQRQPLSRRADAPGGWEQKHILSGPDAGAHFKGTYDVHD